MVLNAFKSGICRLPPIKETGLPSNLALCLKILTPKLMLHRSPKALAQVTSGNTTENLLYEICQIKYSSYRAKEVTKKV